MEKIGLSLYEQENELFHRWESHLNMDGKVFAKDGVADENQYLSAKYKIIFLAKETNDTGKDWDTREYLKDGVFYKEDAFKKDKAKNYILNKGGNKIKEHSKGKPIGPTFNNIYRWANLFLNDITEFKDYEHVPSGSKGSGESQIIRQKVFASIGMMNLKKTTGKSTTNRKELDEFLEQNQDFIKKQLHLYQADIIICCGEGVYDGYKKIMGQLSEENKQNGTFRTAIDNKTIVIEFYHPQARSQIKQHYKILQSIKKQYSKELFHGNLSRSRITR